MKNEKDNSPLVSIVTIVYNVIEKGRREYVKECIESVRNQTYTNIEHIIIDGASTDGTIEFLKEFSDKGDVVVFSEPDKGIYDAMNKGIDRANGKYINFLNSDDYYHNKKGVELSVEYLERNSADFSFADAQFLEDNGNVIFWEGTYSKFLFGILYCHQTMFVKTDLLKEIKGFDLSYEVSSDSDLMIKLYANGNKYVHVPHNLISFRLGGFSSENTAISQKDHSRSFYKHLGKDIGLTEYECFLLWGFVFMDKYSYIKQAKLIDKIPEKYGRALLLEKFLTEIKENEDDEVKLQKKYLLFGFIPIVKQRLIADNRYYYLFNILPIIKIRKFDNIKYYDLFGFIPFLKLERFKRKRKRYLFGVLPFLKTKYSDSVLNY